MTVHQIKFTCIATSTWFASIQKIAPHMAYVAKLITGNDKDSLRSTEYRLQPHQKLESNPQLQSSVISLRSGAIEPFWLAFSSCT